MQWTYTIIAIIGIIAGLRFKVPLLIALSLAVFVLAAALSAIFLNMSAGSAAFFAFTLLGTLQLGYFFSATISFFLRKVRQRLEQYPEKIDPAMYSAEKREQIHMIP